jgi:hypothetical protein
MANRMTIARAAQNHRIGGLCVDFEGRQADAARSMVTKYRTSLAQFTSVVGSIGSLKLERAISAFYSVSRAGSRIRRGRGMRGSAWGAEVGSLDLHTRTTPVQIIKAPGCPRACTVNARRLRTRASCCGLFCATCPLGEAVL